MLAALLAAIAACAGDDQDDEGTTGVAAQTSSTGDPDGDATTGPSATTGDPVVPCDNWAQDCPPGQKCSAYAADDGDAFDALRCVDVSGAGQPGDPCVAQGRTGVDDCAKGSMCWYTDEPNPVCVPLCAGTSADHADGCGRGFRCAVSADGLLNLCLPGCDPLGQDCEPGQQCIFSGYDYTCQEAMGDASGGYHDECSYFSPCGPGLDCLLATRISGCEQLGPYAGCCTPFCKTTATDDGPCEVDTCVPLNYAGPQWLGLEDLGVCLKPE